MKKKIRKYNIYWLGLLSIIGIIFSPNAEKIILSDNNLSPMGIITEENPLIYQLNFNNPIDKIGLLFGTYNKENEIEYEFNIYTEDELIYYHTFNANKLVDNTVHYFSIPKLKENQKYYLELKPVTNYNENLGITVYTYKNIKSEQVPYLELLSPKINTFNVFLIIIISLLIITVLRNCHNIYKKIVTSLFMIILFVNLFLNKQEINIGIILFFLLCVSFFYLFNKFSIKEFNNFLFKYRFILAILIFLICVINGVFGFSIGMYDFYIQPDFSQPSFQPIFGNALAIRSDEWAVQTPFYLSQYATTTPFSYYNDNVRSAATDMFVIMGAPVKDIVSLAKPFNFGFLFLNPEMGLSFMWFGRLISLFLISFEFFLVLTKRNSKISLVGAIFITLAPTVQWWFSTSIVDMLIYGQLAIVLIYYYLNIKNKLIKFFLGIIFIICAIGYFATWYLPWMISFMYIYATLGIYILIKYYKEHRRTLFDLIVLSIVCISILFIIIRIFYLGIDSINAVSSTVYPGERFEVGGNGALNLFIYPILPFLPYINYPNPCELSQFYSFFPLPILSTIFIFYKQKVKNYLSVILLIPAFILGIYIIFGFSPLLSQITMLYMVADLRAIVPFSYCLAILIILNLNDIKQIKVYKVEKRLINLVSVIFIGYSIYLCSIKYSEVLNSVHVFILLIMATIIIFILNKGNLISKINFISIVLVSISVIGGIVVNPLHQSTDVIYEKPISNFIQSKILEDKDGIWISDQGWVTSNFLLMQGAKVLSSTNHYPNLEIWKIIDSEKKYEEIYNRYFHFNIRLTNNETDISLVTPDSLLLSLNVNKLKDLNIKYVYTVNNLEEYNTERVKFNKIYDEYSTKIYELSFE